MIDTLTLLRKLHTITTRNNIPCELDWIVESTNSIYALNDYFLAVISGGYVQVYDIHGFVAHEYFTGSSNEVQHQAKQWANEQYKKSIQNVDK